MRSNDNISWIWALKVATALVTSDNPLNTTAQQEVTHFIKKYHSKIMLALKETPPVLTKASIEELNAVIELFLSLATL